VIVAIMMVYGATLIVNQHRRMRADIELRGLALARGMAAIGTSVARENLFLMQDAFMVLGEQHDVRHSMVLAPDHMIVASSQPNLIGQILEDAAVAKAESLQSETTMEGRAAGVDDQTLVIMEPLWSKSIVGTTQGEPGPSLSPVSRQLLGWVRVELSLEASKREAVRLLIQQLVATALLLLVAVYGVNTIIRRLNRSLYASETRLRSIVETAAEGIVVVDMVGMIESVNPAGNYLLGAGGHELIGKALSQLVEFPPERGAIVRNQESERAKPGASQTLRCETVAKRATGQSFPVEFSVTEMTIEGARKLMCLIRDITERKRTEGEINRLAYYDGLTGLPNRVLFQDRVTQALRYARRHHLYAAMLLLDLDRFKQVNDSLGHKIGDLLLQAVAKRLMDAIRHSDSVGRKVAPELSPIASRLGGDEFTVFLTNLAHAQDAGIVGRRILDMLAEPIVLEGHEIFMTGSLGIACFPADTDDADLLMKHADTAMYHAKSEGRNNFQFFSSAMNASIQQRVQIESQLRKALDREELMAYFQPRMEVRTRGVVGAEAVVRWRHPERGILLPAEFVPVAQESGLIQAIDGWMFRQACREIQLLNQLGLPPLKVSVNVSNSLFREKTFTDLIAQALTESGLPAHLLELELTESIILRHAEPAIILLKALKAMGVSLAIDDFGTGYSSLSYLHRLPVDTLKIDQSFVQGLSHSRESKAIVRAIVAMGHSLEMRVVAEGVETDEQMSFLVGEGCDEVQGYLFSKPLSADQMTDFMKQQPAQPANPATSQGSEAA
jgi:diguanylate cyclase (GGDEF)-like protein/PAS domain S-box-containing protein